MTETSSKGATSPVAERAMAEADRLHDLGFNCAETTLGAILAATGLKQHPLRIASGFGGGIGRTGSVCGAVTGAVMAMGLANGRNTPEDKDTYEAVNAEVRRFLADFQGSHGTIECSVLTGYDLSDLSDPTVWATFLDDPVRKEKCARCIRTAARLASKAIARMAREVLAVGLGHIGPVD